MARPDDVHSAEQLAAMAEEYFRWRYCPHCRAELPTDEQLPPYSWVHDVATREHRSRPR